MKRPLSPRLRAMFALPANTAPDPAPTLLPLAHRLHAQLRPGQIALITGASGAGKSSLARALASLAPSHASPASSWTPDLRRLCAEGPGTRAPCPPSNPGTPIIDLLTGPLRCRLSILSSVGLADAHLFLRRAEHLSVGEHARLEIALALNAATRPRHPSDATPTLVLDEFCSTLDRPTARLVARLLRRTISRTPTLRAICLTAHDDLADSLAPDLTLHLSPGAVVASPTDHAPRPRAVVAAPSDHADQPKMSDTRPCSTRHSPPTPEIQPATFSDYLSLAHHHYRPTRPATLAGPHAIRRAIDPDTGELLAVLVVSMPALNAAWRDTIWPARYRTTSKPADARRLSSELRTITRVIVAPAHRGLGIATALVRHYLANPLTPATEAIAAMGIASPFFAAAGMTPYRLPPTPRDARLLDALAHLCLTPESLLPTPSPACGGGVRQGSASRTEGVCDPPTCHRVSPVLRAYSVRATADLELAHDLLLRELRHWANRSRATRPLLTSPDPTALPRAAAAALLSPRLVYAHVAPNHALAQEPIHAPPHKLAA